MLNMKIIKVLCCLMFLIVGTALGTTIVMPGPGQAPEPELEIISATLDQRGEGDFCRIVDISNKKKIKLQLSSEAISDSDCSPESISIEPQVTTPAVALTTEITFVIKPDYSEINRDGSGMGLIFIPIDEHGNTIATQEVTITLIQCRKQKLQMPIPTAQTWPASGGAMPKSMYVLLKKARAGKAEVTLLFDYDITIQFADQSAIINLTFNLKPSELLNALTKLMIDSVIYGSRARLYFRTGEFKSCAYSVDDILAVEAYRRSDDMMAETYENSLLLDASCDQAIFKKHSTFAEQICRFLALPALEQSHCQFSCDVLAQNIAFQPIEIPTYIKSSSASESKRYRRIILSAVDRCPTIYKCELQEMSLSAMKALVLYLFNSNIYIATQLYKIEFMGELTTAKRAILFPQIPEGTVQAGEYIRRRDLIATFGLANAGLERTDVLFGPADQSKIKVLHSAEACSEATEVLLGESGNKLIQAFLKEYYRWRIIREDSQLSIAQLARAIAVYEAAYKELKEKIQSSRSVDPSRREKLAKQFLKAQSVIWIVKLIKLRQEKAQGIDIKVLLDNLLSEMSVFITQNLMLEERTQEEPEPAMDLVEGTITTLEFRVRPIITLKITIPMITTFTVTFGTIRAMTLTLTLTLTPTPTAEEIFFAETKSLFTQSDVAVSPQEHERDVLVFINERFSSGNAISMVLLFIYATAFELSQSCDFVKITCKYIIDQADGDLSRLQAQLSIYQSAKDELGADAQEQLKEKLDMDILKAVLGVN